MSKKDEYLQSLTDRLIEQIEKNQAPWQRPFEAGDYTNILPINAKGTAYKGANMLNLMLVAEKKGYTDNRWLTFNAAKEAGAKIKKGEKGSDIFFFKFSEEKDKDGKPILDEDGKPLVSRPIVIWSKVFNGEQIDGLPPKEVTVKQLEDWERHEAAERILKASNVPIIHKAGERAYYSPHNDHIVLPERSQFKTPDAYYATALHELGHATGHESRLNRDLSGEFRSESYAKEELRAEIASMTIGQELQIGHDPSQHIAYLQSWAKVIQNDPKEIFRAVKDADAIHQFVLSLDSERVKEAPIVEKDNPDLKESVKDKPQEEIKNTKLFINVPFAEKDEAKALGAKWDKENKSWYVPAGEDLSKFEKWSKEQIISLDPKKSDKTYLYTIPSEKDEVKALGARWDKENSLWYAPANADIAKFAKWTERPSVPTPEEAFANHLREQRIVVPSDHPKMDGKAHRLANENSDSKNVMYQLYPNHGGVPSGRVTNFSRDAIPEKWTYPMEYVQRQQNIEVVDRAKYGADYKPEPKLVQPSQEQNYTSIQAKNEDKEQLYNKTAERVQELFKISPIAAQHDYLARKGVGANEVVHVVPDARMLPPELAKDIIIANDWKQANFLRQNGNNPDNKMIVQKDSLIIPKYNNAGELRSFETIQPNGSKYYLKDSEPKGLVLQLGNIENGKPFVVAEGYATGATFKEQAKIPTIITFGKHGFESLATELRERYPDSKIYFAADNDHQKELQGKVNGGIENATKAADAINGHVLIPQFEIGDTGKDWNDVFIDKGIDEFRSQLKSQLEQINGVKQVEAIETVGKDLTAEIDKTTIDFGTLNHAQQKPIRNFIHVLEERFKDNPVELQQALKIIQDKIPDIASGKILISDISQNKEIDR